MQYTPNYQLKMPEASDVVSIADLNNNFLVLDDIIKSGVEQVMKNAYPIGSVYINASDGRNPSEILGFGTWQRLGQGRMMIGADSVYTAGSTGGAATVTLTAAQSGLKAHSHSTTITQPVFKYTAPAAHTHNLSSSGYAYIAVSATGSGYVTNWQVSAASKTYAARAIKATEGYTESSVSHSAGTGLGGKTDSATGAGTTNGATASRTTNVAVTVDNSASSNATEAHNNMPPYIAVYIWKRTA